MLLEIFKWNDWDLRYSDFCKYLSTQRTRITTSGRQVNNCKNAHKLCKNLPLPENLSLTVSETGCLRFERFRVATMILRIAFFPSDILIFWCIKFRHGQNKFMVIKNNYRAFSDTLIEIYLINKNTVEAPLAVIPKLKDLRNDEGEYWNGYLN